MRKEIVQTSTKCMHKVLLSFQLEVMTQHLLLQHSLEEVAPQLMRHNLEGEVAQQLMHHNLVEEVAPQLMHLNLGQFQEWAVVVVPMLMLHNLVQNQKV